MTHEFRTKVDIDVYGSGKDDMMVSTATIEWSLDFEMRAEGVKSIYITPRGLFFEMEWTENIHHDFDKDIWEEKIMFDEFDIDLTKGDWKIDEEIVIDGSIYPSHVNVDFDTKTITVS